MTVSRGIELLERESELAELVRYVAAVRAGTGRLVLVEGPAGIGKTELLTGARSLADEAGMMLARARGSDLETGFAFGVVRQLFEPLLRTRSRQERNWLLRGAAGVAADVLVIGERDATRTEVRLPDTVHGLYWLTLNLAERGPLVALIDDAHWADRSSLRFLGYLAGRLEGVGVLVVVASRPTEPASDEMLTSLARERVATVMRLRPLSVAATAELIEREYHEQVGSEFAQACRDSTGGNPFYLRELVLALRADGIAPTASEAPQVAGHGAASVARSVLARIAGLSPASARVAQALALLGGEARVPELSELATLDEDLVVTAVDQLTGAGIVVGADSVAFAHPIVRASIYADIPAGARAMAHRRAARVLASSDASAERLAAHLLAARPAGDPWTVGVLSEAAEDALSRGGPDSAVAYLTRALAEPPADGELQKLLALLGRSEYLAYQVGASEHLVEAMEIAPTAIERGDLALEAAKAMIMGDPDRSAAAIQLLERAIGEFVEPGSQMSMRLEAHLLAAAGLKLSTRPLHAERINSVCLRRLGDDPADQLLLANLAQWTLLDGRVPGRFEDLARHAGAAGSPADVACRVAERALAGGLLRDEGSDSQLFYLAIWTLHLADRLDRCAYWLDHALEDARKRGSVLGYGLAEAAQAEVAYRRGDLARAESHAWAAADISPEDATAVLVNILIEQGRFDEADRVLTPYRGLEPQRAAEDADHLLLQPIRAARARLRMAQRASGDAIREVLECGKWLDAWPIKNPSFIAWRSSAALALNHAGAHEHAREKAREEVALAQPLDQPRAVGVALRTLAVIEAGSDQIDMLQAAIAQLQRSPARLEHARALIDYGAVLRRTGHRIDARKPLREGLDLAHRCRAPVLAERARQELLATGARPRRPMLSGREALTPTEARVADMAASGLTTPEIAQALFITPKTVETHLGHAYQKLNIHSRTELPRALSQVRNT